MAAEQNVSSYGKLAVKLRLLREAEWRVEMLPWVVDAQGVAEGRGISCAMTFLDIPMSRNASEEPWSIQR